MKEVLKLNEISPLVNNVFEGKYEMKSECEAPEAIILRSFKMHGYALPESVKCIGRAGAGTNNIPCDEYAKLGVVVFNTPGANANAVNELTVAALLLASRGICEGFAWANTLADGEKTVGDQVEKGKKNFGGSEILGKTLGVWGLGAIGRKVAASAKALGMRVIGYDPFFSGECTAELVTAEKLYAESDYITFHVPLLDTTRGMVNKEALASMKRGVKILNFSRGEIVNNADMLAAIEAGQVSKYVNDFPSSEIINKKGVVSLPHLGASTEEAEDNCAVMVAEEIRDFIENGNIKNSVNFPAVSLEGKFNNKALVLFDAEKLSASDILSGKEYDAVSSGTKKGMGAVLVGLKSDCDFNADGILKVYKF